jgi:hypothetical protein
VSDGHLREDILEQGSEREPRFTFPDWRPSRAAGILAIVTLVAGLGIGYSVGKQQGSHSAAAPAPPAASTTPAGQLPPTYPWNPSSVVRLIAGMGLNALTQEPGTCSAQVGQDYEVGIPVTNASQQPVTLRTVKPVPGVTGMLSVLSWQWTPCGYNGAGATVQVPGTTQVITILQPGQSSWLTATVKPLVACPTGAPLQFHVTYLVNGRALSSTLRGFSDLSTVHFAGCASRG